MGQPPGLRRTPSSACTVETGRLHRPEEAAQGAFSLWEERERRRAEILAQVDIAEAELARGEGRIKESMRQLSEDVRQ